MARYLQVVTAVAKKSEARALAALAVERRLAACVQIVGPVESHYRWQGKRERAREFLCVFKTRVERYAKLETALRADHPYKTPEILAFPIRRGSAGYLKWIDAELGISSGRKS